jgi:hypothetical protein
MKEEQEIKDNKDTTSLGPITWLKYSIIIRIDYLKENKESTLYLSE